MYTQGTDKYIVAKTHRLPHLYRSLFIHEPYDFWLFHEKRPATSGILIIFGTLYPTRIRSLSNTHKQMQVGEGGVGRWKIWSMLGQEGTLLRNSTKIKNKNQIEKSKMDMHENPKWSEIGQIKQKKNDMETPVRM